MRIRVPAQGNFRCCSDELPLRGYFSGRSLGCTERRHFGRGNGQVQTFSQEQYWAQVDSKICEHMGQFMEGTTCGSNSSCSSYVTK